MPHMLAQEHMTFVDALRYGTTRDQATFNAAIAAIGSSVAALILTATGNGVWTFTANVSSPGNVMIIIPWGVSVSGAPGITWTCSGTILAYNGSWLTGGMTVNKSAVSTPIEASILTSTTMTISNGGSGSAFQYNQGATGPAMIRLFHDTAVGATGLSISRNDSVANSTWQMRTVNSGDFQLLRPAAGTPMMTVNNNGVLIGAATSPTFMLDVNSDQVAKTTAGSWLSRTSDARTKNVLRPYTNGMAELRTLPQIQVFTFNGQAGTPTDGKEYIGYIANDLQPVAPELVLETGLYLEGDPDPLLTVDINPLHYTVINALKELDARVTALEPPLAAREAAAEEEEDHPARTHPRRRGH